MDSSAVISSTMIAIGWYVWLLSCLYSSFAITKMVAAINFVKAVRVSLNRSLGYISKLLFQIKGYYSTY